MCECAVFMWYDLSCNSVHVPKVLWEEKVQREMDIARRVNQNVNSLVCPLNIHGNTFLYVDFFSPTAKSLANVGISKSSSGFGHIRGFVTIDRVIKIAAHQKTHNTTQKAGKKHLEGTQTTSNNGQT